MRFSKSAQWHFGISAIIALTVALLFNFLAITGTQANTPQLTITPAKAILGDTIHILVTLPAPEIAPPPATPVITIKNKTYPAFRISPQQWRFMIPTTPLDRHGIYQGNVKGLGIDTPVQFRVGDRRFPVQDIWFNPAVARITGTDYEFDRADAFKQTISPQKYWQGKLLRPNHGAISAGYGIRRYYNGVFAKNYYHRGVDYANYTGSPVIAPASGYVRLVGTVKQGFELQGNTVGIDHGQGLTSVFLHLHSIAVKEGDFVTAGQVIGTVGATGAVTGAHLHWGLYVHGECVDPHQWLHQAIL